VSPQAWAATVGALLAVGTAITKALLWWRAKAVADAERHAEERAHRAAMAGDMAHVRKRVDESHERIDEMAVSLHETRERVAEMWGAAHAAKKSGISAVK